MLCETISLILPITLIHLRKNYISFCHFMLFVIYIRFYIYICCTVYNVVIMCVYRDSSEYIALILFRFSTI